MFDLFEQKQSPEERLETCLAKRDWDGLARTYYDMGAAAMDNGELNKAILWLNRADTVYSASDRIYKKTSKNRLFHKEIVTDCSDRLEILEDASSLYNEIPAEIEEKMDELDDSQIRIWGLLSIARLVVLGERLGRLPGCEVLGRLGEAVDIILKSLQEPISQAQYQQLTDICNAIYDLGDSEAYYAGGEINVPGGAPFQVFDLNGMMGAILEINMYLDNHLSLLSDISLGIEPPDAEICLSGCSLLPDYYVRTGTESLENVPQIKAELQRIWSDYDFVCSETTWEQTAERVKNYKTLDILQL